MIERSLSMVLRVTIQLRNFGELKGKGQQTLFDHTYTGNHVAIFECQLKTPPSLALVDTTLLDFANLHRINFKDWKLVDVDHFMKGNSFFNEIKSELDWKNDMDRVFGVFEKGESPKFENQNFEETLDMAQVYKNFLSLKEPNSNIGLMKLEN